MINPYETSERGIEELGIVREKFLSTEEIFLLGFIKDSNRNTLREFSKMNQIY